MIDVIVPYYNKEKYIKDTIYSIDMSICSEPFKITIVDDCGSEPIPEDILKREDINIIRCPNNLKLPGARNYGISNTSGDYVVCIDSDDMIPSNYLQDSYDKLIGNGVDIVYNDFVMFYDDGRRNSVNFPEFDIEILRRNPFIHCAAMYKRSVWTTNGGYDEKMIYGWEDYDFWLTSAKNGFKFLKTKDTNLFYRQYDSSMINNTNKRLMTDIIPYLRTKHNGFYLG